jgi:hypothetical protein
MAATSDNKYDVYNWILEVAKSCTTLNQSIQVNKLTQLFLTRYDDFDMYCDLSDQTWRESSKAIETYLENDKYQNNNRTKR